MKRFFQLVEIKTKITGIFPFLMTVALLYYQRQPIRIGVTALFFLSMFCFDMTTTAINNFIDSKSNGQSLPYSRSVAKTILFLLLVLSVAGGLLLVYYTDVVVLLTGALCFVCGVLYTYGPIPISRTPLGEALSGIFYGFFIPFLILYINLPPGSIVSFAANLRFVDLRFYVLPMIRLLLLASVPSFLTANIMLANNICDLQKDIIVKRHTLPYYLGHSSLYLFAALNYLCYASILAMVILRIISPVCLLALITVVPIYKNIRMFFEEQVKEKTFIVSIWNYVIIMGTVTMLIFLSRFIG